MLLKKYMRCFFFCFPCKWIDCAYAWFVFLLISFFSIDFNSRRIYSWCLHIFNGILIFWKNGTNKKKTHAHTMDQRQMCVIQRRSATSLFHWNNRSLSLSLRNVQTFPNSVSIETVASLILSMPILKAHHWNSCNKQWHTINQYSIRDRSRCASFGRICFEHCSGIATNFICRANLSANILDTFNENVAKMTIIYVFIINVFLQSFSTYESMTFHSFQWFYIVAWNFTTISSVSYWIFFLYK